jgi:uncharacterized protein (DUF4415 family)
MRARGESLTDWARVDAMTEEELERSIADDPDWKDLPEDWVDHAVPVIPATKQLISLRIDPDVLEWFRAQGQGYQTRMNAALRAYVEARRGKR